MPEPTLPAVVRRTPTFVGLVTLVIGGGLLAAPERAGRLAGLEPDAARAFGIADLALVPGLLFARRRSRWMKARAGLNVLMAAYFALVVRPSNREVGQAAAGSLLALTVADGTVAAQLRRAGA